MYRKTVWFFKGLKEYTKGGYLKAAKNFCDKDLELDIHGKSFMITGANSGIGKCAALAVASRGGTVHMVCRNPTRGEEAKNEIVEQSGNHDIHLHILDLSDAKSVASFAKDFSASGKSLDTLINNAGCMVNTREVTSDGYEKNFATNTLGTHLLTVGLLPALEKSNAPKVIIVTSGGMLTSKLDVKDLQFENMKPFDGTMAYAQNKRQQVVMTEMYAKKYTKVHFSCMHPGWADTPAVRLSMPGFYEKMKDRLRTAEQGADTLIWLAIVDPEKVPNGEFFQDRVSVSKHLTLASTKSSDEDKSKLMSTLDEMTKQFLQ